MNIFEQVYSEKHPKLCCALNLQSNQGPILAGTFGTVIQDRALQRLGVKNELIGLGLCLSFGFLFGIIYGLTDHWSGQFWLTTEMVARYRQCALQLFGLFICDDWVGVQFGRFLYQLM